MLNVILENPLAIVLGESVLTLALQGLGAALGVAIAKACGIGRSAGKGLDGASRASYDAALDSARG